MQETIDRSWLIWFFLIGSLGLKHSRRLCIFTQRNHVYGHNGQLKISPKRQSRILHVEEPLILENSG